MTQLGTDPEGNVEVLQQIPINDPTGGIPRVNYYEMRNVCDTDGNTYYSYGALIGKIDVDGNRTEINVNTALGLSPADYEVQGLALDNGLDVGGRNLYIMINTLTTATNAKIYKINVSSFTLSASNFYVASNQIASYYFRIDKFNNLWVGRNAASSTTNGSVINADTQNVVNYGFDGNNRIIYTAVNQIGNGYGLCGGAPTTRMSRYVYNNIIVANTNMVISENIGYVIDLICDKDDTLWALSNQQNGTTQNILYKMTSIETTPVITVIPLTKEDLTTPLYYCYNLHTNLEGDIFFSTYDVIGGYNIYIIAVGTTTITKYVAGLGSKTTGNDPYAFFLTDKGHTGANLS